MAALFVPPILHITNANGAPISGGQAHFFLTGTLTAAPVYTTSALSVQHTQPVEANSSGRCEAIYLDPDVTYRCRITDAAGTLIPNCDIDPINDTFRLDLAASTGAALIGTTGGSTVQADLDALEADITALEVFTPAGEGTALDYKTAALSVAQGPRDALIYYSATSFKVFRKFATMGGFRHRGQYSRGRAPTVAMPADGLCSVDTGLGAESSAKPDAWYAGFACSNVGDTTAVTKMMPFLRIGTPVGNVCPIIEGGEAVYDLVTVAEHDWTGDNNLAGCDCLVIAENQRWTGRTTTVVANSTSSIELADAGALIAGEYLLAAPPGYAHYVYLCSGYFEPDGAEGVALRNVVDTGILVQGRNINLTTPDISAGDVASPGVQMQCAGFICPLATGAVIADVTSLSTASLGACISNIASDGGGTHVIYQASYTKQSDNTFTDVDAGIQIGFLYYQSYWLFTTGVLVATRTACANQVRGFIEP